MAALSDLQLEVYVDDGDAPLASPREVSPLPTAEDIITGQYPPSHKSMGSPHDVSYQISELRAIVEAQGLILNRLLDALGQSKGKQRENTDSSGS